MVENVPTYMSLLTTCICLYKNVNITTTTTSAAAAAFIIASKLWSLLLYVWGKNLVS
jgi:hypothetical protein